MAAGHLGYKEGRVSSCPCLSGGGAVTRTAAPCPPTSSITSHHGGTYRAWCRGGGQAAGCRRWTPSAPAAGRNPAGSASAGTPGRPPPASTQKPISGAMAQPRGPTAWPRGTAAQPGPPGAGRGAGPRHSRPPSRWTRCAGCGPAWPPRAPAAAAPAGTQHGRVAQHWGDPTHETWPPQTPSPAVLLTHRAFSFLRSSASSRACSFLRGQGASGGYGGHGGHSCGARVLLWVSVLAAMWDWGGGVQQAVFPTMGTHGQSPADGAGGTVGCRELRVPPWELMVRAPLMGLGAMWGAGGFGSHHGNPWSEL